MYKEFRIGICILFLFLVWLDLVFIHASVEYIDHIFYGIIIGLIVDLKRIKKINNTKILLIVSFLIIGELCSDNTVSIRDLFFSWILIIITLNLAEERFKERIWK